uniref:Uncharacterized protein n=1 Tax=Candidatus Kentrum sp. LPFa TaxID=2126335 RepID=A0A450VZ82_9GAMM|nr:MAG: hypothetical protein BECKLPF1236A_GA0070988_1003210 [Candidatus Kentron sp. LPFa]VFK26099.1 MAG: hypothetical protein BECKLPF1236C_GA0070990_100309 [Candidatus Kentron sp. LPFa]
MTLIETYHKYRVFAQRKKLSWITPSPLVNAVDNKSFNYSLEEPILREFGSYFSFTHPYRFSTMQPCTRGADIGRIKKGKTQNHLALFHIFPTAFSLSPNLEKINVYHRDAIFDTVDYLRATGIDIRKLKVTYFSGGNLHDISNGYVSVHKTFPADIVTLQSFLEAGLENNQLVPLANLDTFVATFDGDEDFLAGNRFEIYHPLSDNSALLEIATGESLKYRQVRRNKVTIDILPAPCCATPVAIGLERLQAILENRTSVRSISALTDIADLLAPLLGSSARKDKLIAADFFRAAHLVLAQTHKTRLNASISEQRRVILSHLCRQSWNQDILASNFLPVLRRNAALHPWLPELADGAEIVADLLIKNIERRRYS